MRRVRVAQCMGSDAFLQPSAASRDHTRIPDDLRRQRFVRAPVGDGPGKEIGRRPHPAVGSQRVQQRRAQRDIAIAAPLSVPNVSEHPPTVDVLDPEMSQRAFRMPVEYKSIRIVRF
jgi:hypothetical protein